MTPVPPPRWTDAQLAGDIEQSKEYFRETRMGEPLTYYLEQFAYYAEATDDLLEATNNLARLRDLAVDVLTDEDWFRVVRFLPGPMISEADLAELAQTTLSAGVLRSDPVRAQRVVDTVMLGLDGSRFPWLNPPRRPQRDERRTAVVATAAMIANQRTQTWRRTEYKRRQEQAVADCLLANGYTQVETRTVLSMRSAPNEGEFCAEALFGERKADLIVGLWDGRIMPIECKVSNSATNSVKRIQNDVASKAEVWISDFGDRHVVPAAVLSGVYGHHNLGSVQGRGLTLFWEHDLEAMAEFIYATRE